MIGTLAPLRISFIGGGTDIPKFYNKYGGEIVACAIDKYIWTFANKLSEKIIILKYSKSEVLKNKKKIKHRLIRKILSNYSNDRIDLNFYVDAENYLPIRFFEDWMSYITNEDKRDATSNSYTYRVKYPEGNRGYTASGLKVIKFEKDYKNSMTYEFVKSFPIQITSIPVSYDGSSLLQCSVSLTYIRYIVSTDLVKPYFSTPGYNPFQIAAANAANSIVDRLTGNDLLGDIAGGVVGNLF